VGTWDMLLLGLRVDGKRPRMVDGDEKGCTDGTDRETR
jgi:hypothetical protein